MDKDKKIVKDYLELFTNYHYSIDANKIKIEYQEDSLIAYYQKTDLNGWRNIIKAVVGITKDKVLIDFRNDVTLTTDNNKKVLTQIETQTGEILNLGDHLLLTNDRITLSKKVNGPEDLYAERIEREYQINGDEIDLLNDAGFKNSKKTKEKVKRI